MPDTPNYGDVENPIPEPDVPGEVLEVTPMPPARARENRVTIIEQVYHQNTGEEPRVFSTNTSRVVKETEQPYERTTILKAGVRTKVNTGWIAWEHVGILKIKNESADSTIEVWIDTQKNPLGVTELLKLATIPPEDSLRICPVGNRLYLSCAVDVKFTIVALPA